MNIENNFLEHSKNREVVQHEVRTSFHELIDYPTHDLRDHDPVFKDIRHQRIVVNNQPCFICGITDKIIKGPENPNPKLYTSMELHHCLVEWAMANGIDSNKWNNNVLPYLKNTKKGVLLSPYSTVFNKQTMSPEEIKDWAHHGDENLLVLCNVHHRSPYTGIHTVSYPVWISQLYMEDRYLKQEPPKIHD